MLWRALVLVAVTAVLVAGSFAYARNEGLVRTVVIDRPRSPDEWFEGGRLPESVRPGAEVFAESGCLQCHLYLGAGSRYRSAPDLSAEGLRGRGVAWQVRHLRNPSTPVHREKKLWYGRHLSEDRLRELALFLEASKTAAR